MATQEFKNKFEEISVEVSPDFADAYFSLLSIVKRLNRLYDDHVTIYLNCKIKENGKS